MLQQGVSPELIKIEITESLLLEQNVDALASLNKLWRIGVHIAIDEFGAGYFSLSYLKNMPIDILKIDRSFILEAASCHAEVTIAESDHCNESSTEA